MQSRRWPWRNVWRTAIEGFRRRGKANEMVTALRLRSVSCAEQLLGNTSFSEQPSPVPGISTIHMPATSNPAKTSWGWERKYGLANQTPRLGSWHYEPSRTSQNEPDQISSYSCDAAACRRSSAQHLAYLSTRNTNFALLMFLVVMGWRVKGAQKSGAESIGDWC